VCIARLVKRTFRLRRLRPCYAKSCSTPRTELFTLWKCLTETETENCPRRSSRSSERRSRKRMYTCIGYIHCTHLHTAALAEGAGADRVFEFKLAVMVYRCLHRMTPPYLAEEFHQSSADKDRQRLRSASSSSLVVRRTRLSTIGDRTFPVAASFPTVEHSAAECHVSAVTDCF